MVLNKRGMFFTIIIILLLSLFALSYSLYFVVKDRTPITKRVNTMENFLFSVKENLERELYAFGFRMIFLMEERIVSTGDYISNVEDVVEEGFFYGTFSGENSSILIGVNYEDLLSSIKLKASKINVDVNFSNPEINISQEDPWNVVFSISFDLNVTDKANLASWNTRQNVRTLVEIEGFEDPIYPIETGKIQITNQINRTMYSFPAGSVDLLAHTDAGYYVASINGPSFLKRLTGDLSADENGIESLVYLPDLSSQGVSTSSKSVVDYIYFSGSNPGYCQITGMPGWFRLDDGNQNHTIIYGVDGVKYNCV